VLCRQNVHVTAVNVCFINHLHPDEPEYACVVTMRYITLQVNSFISNISTSVTSLYLICREGKLKLNKRAYIHVCVGMINVF
jgi:hypothetical protein